MSDLLLTVYLHPPVLQTAQAGKLGILNRIRALLEARGWQIRIERSGPDARAQAPDIFMMLLLVTEPGECQ